MKAIAFLFAALFVLATGVLADDLKTIDGQIFIATKGGENIKLGLVQVSIFDLKTLSDVMEEKKKAAVPVVEYFTPLLQMAEQAEKNTKDAEDKAAAAADASIGNGNFDAAEAAQDKAMDAEKKALDRLVLCQGFMHYPISDLYFFDSLPDPLQTTKSDADGKFAFHVPNGSYVLVASASCNAGSKMIGDTSFPVTEFYYWMVKVKVEGGNSTVMLANDNLTTSGSPDSLVAALDDDFKVADAMKEHNLSWLLDFIASQKKQDTDKGQEEGTTKAKVVDKKPSSFSTGDTVYNLKRINITTDDGITAIQPGTELKIVTKGSDGTLHVQEGNLQTDVPQSEVTNDPDRAAALRANN